MHRLSQISLVVLILLFTILPIRGLWNKRMSGHIGPPHGENFTLSCDVCHSSKSWKVDYGIYSFDHDNTALPLIGQHAKTDCRLCHPTLIFSDAETECFQCHTDRHETTVGKDCSRCHTPHSWLVHNITQIHQQSRFPLVGVHARVDCYKCHHSESFQRYDVIGTECYSCHRSDYESALNPRHNGFSTNCTDCHNIFSNGWTGTGFNHSFFPLTLGHAIDCKMCHIDGQFSKISNECVSCHQDNFNSTTKPIHTCAGFSTDCKMCHTTIPGWKPANWQHANFALTNGHSGRECTECHKDCNYPATSGECISCHQTDYNNTTNPVHSNLGFSTTCTECHTTAPGWKPAKYTQHDALSFPIYSGKHSGEWSSCTDCHANASNYKEFTCISCHEHNKTEMDDKHSGETGYSYTSAACLNCHPNGSAKK